MMTILSLILSKTFLLAQDDKIKDAAIREQIRQDRPAIPPSAPPRG
ncbi:MAG: hypothetical protein HC880_21285 [Bacteroidia bacterium]|nr:hypothetical protein [Bacteroidia bacterium]